jgi:hypothetical protein
MSLANINIEAFETKRSTQRKVYVPVCAEHNGVDGVIVALEWTCPVCGGPRGEIKDARSYDGSRILFCHGWSNPCGHVDTYDAVRKEAAGNGLNR